MKAKDTLNKIAEIIGINLSETLIKLEEMVLDNGTRITAEIFEADQAVFIKTDDDVQIALPVGEYKLEDGRILNVEQEGVIKEIIEAKEEVVVEDEPEAVVEDLEKEDLAEEADVADWKGMEIRIKNLEDAVSNLKADKESNVDMTVTDNGALKSRTVKEEFTEDIKSATASPISDTEDYLDNNEPILKEELSEVKEELSEVAKPIKHNPEAGNQSKPDVRKSYPNTIQNKIYDRLN